MSYWPFYEGTDDSTQILPKMIFHFLKLDYLKRILKRGLIPIPSTKTIKIRNLIEENREISDIDVFNNPNKNLPFHSQILVIRSEISYSKINANSTSQLTPFWPSLPHPIFLMGFLFVFKGCSVLIHAKLQYIIIEFILRCGIPSFADAYLRVPFQRNGNIFY